MTSPSSCATSTRPHTVFAPGSDQGIACVKLCKELRAHKRPLMVIGGEAYLWNMPEAWSVMVRQLLLIARSQGVMAIDGVSYYRNMRRAKDGRHIAKGKARMDMLVVMI